MLSRCLSEGLLSFAVASGGNSASASGAAMAMIQNNVNTARNMDTLTATCYHLAMDGCATPKTQLACIRFITAGWQINFGLVAKAFLSC